MRLSILIPFRDADGTRTPAKQWIVRRWAHFYPQAEIIVAADDGIDPFNKSLAVNKAAAHAHGDIFAILDADTWIDQLYFNKALKLIGQGVPWVVPARRSLRLRKDFSERLLKLNPTGPLPPVTASHAENGLTPVVGFLWLVTRKGFESVGPYGDWHSTPGGYGMDERIRGWGGEDVNFTRAMDILVGRHHRQPGTVMCLWHARPRDQDGWRVWKGQGRRRDTDQAKEVLGRRYAAAKTRAAMLKVLAT